MGAAEQNIIQQCLNSGEELPEEIVNRPEPMFGSSFYINAFNELDTERSHGMGITQIPWSSIMQYAHIEGMDRQEARDFLTVIRHIDYKYCLYLDKEHGNSSNPTEPNTEN